MFTSLPRYLQSLTTSVLDCVSVGDAVSEPMASLLSPTYPDLEANVEDLALPLLC